MTRNPEKALPGTGVVPWRVAGCAAVLIGLAITLWCVATSGLFGMSSTISSALDEAMWAQALGDRPVPKSLDASRTVWRERTGASGDRIIERLDEAVPEVGQPTVSVLNEVGGSALPAPVLASETVTDGAKSDRESLVEPARFDGLATGDRITVRTKDGHIYEFEVVEPQSRKPPDRPDGVTFTLRIAPHQASGEGDSYSVHAMKPVPPHGQGPMELQHKL